MTRAVHIVRGAHDDKPYETIAGKREPGMVTRFGLLAANMPSVLARLRPMDATSAGISRFLTMTTPPVVRAIGNSQRKASRIQWTGMTDPRLSQPSAVPAEYQSLYKYLDNRFADTVVLTFAQIERLLGFALPDIARLRQEWWTNAEADSVPSTHSRSWSNASRSAKPNLLAQSVMFERIST